MSETPDTIKTGEIMSAPTAAELLSDIGLPPAEIVDMMKQSDSRTLPIIPRNVRGQPMVMTTHVLLLLEQAFRVGCTVREACIHAGIAGSTFRLYASKFPAFREWSDDLRERPVIIARQTINKALSTSVEAAYLYLRAKRKDEFAEKSIVDHGRAMTVEELEEIAKGEVEIKNMVIDGEVKADTSAEAPAAPVGVPNTPTTPPGATDTATPQPSPTASQEGAA